MGLFVFSDNTLSIGYIVEKPATEETVSGKHFDISAFSGDAFDISIDDMEGQVFIGSTYSRAGVFSFEHPEQSDYYYSVIYPDVYIGDYQGSSEYSLFRIWIRYNAESWLFADNAIIKCGDKRFTASDIDISTDVLDHGTVNEKLLLLVAAKDEEFMDAWVAADSVTIRLKGSKGNVDFVFPSAAKKAIDEMYQTFRPAVGDTWLRNGDYIQ